MLLRNLIYLELDKHFGQRVQSLAKPVCAIRCGTAKIENPQDCETGFPYRSLHCDDVATMPACTFRKPRYRRNFIGTANSVPIQRNAMRILIVEDDPMIGAGIRTGLRQDGYTADWARDGNSAELAVATNEYDAILLDLGLPGRSGLELLAQWRRKRNTVPILIITARDSVEDRIAGLDTGADDYLVKPFDLNELAARLRALLRRRSGRATPVIEHGPLHLDPATHEVRLNGTAVKLSGREFALLHALLQAPGVPLSRSQLEDRLYGWEEEIGSNAVEVHIHALRRKIGSELIRNVRGVGYMVPRQA